jgi:hypothetical protein
MDTLSAMGLQKQPLSDAKTVRFTLPFLAAQDTVDGCSDDKVDLCGLNRVEKAREHGVGTGIGQE